MVVVPVITVPAWLAGGIPAEYGDLQSCGRFSLRKIANALAERPVLDFRVPVEYRATRRRPGSGKGELAFWGQPRCSVRIGDQPPRTRIATSNAPQ